MLHQIDSSRELFLRPYLNGVEFVRPQECHASLSSFGDLMESSLATYIMTTDSRVHDANEATLHLNHVPSLRSLVGLKATDIWRGEAANRMMKHDDDVITKKCLLITDDSAENHTGICEAMLSLKMPVYHKNSVTAVLGMTLQIDANQVSRLANQLMTLIQTKIIHHEQISKIQSALSANEGEVYYSEREREVLALVVKGYTAKKISLMLGLSRRTIEHHIENIKSKAGCSRKYELIYKFANHDLC